MNFVLVEALTFGLGKLVKAAEEMGVILHLVTCNKDFYFLELKKLHSNNLIVTEMDTFCNENIILYCKKLENFAGIINLTDTWANAVQKISSELGLKRQNPQSTTICRNKALLRKTLIEHNLTKGIYLEVDLTFAIPPPTEIIYPIIIKDPLGTGSKNVWFAENFAEMSKILAYIKNKKLLKKVLIETYFQGTLYSVETLSFRGETKVIAVTSRILSDIPLFMEKALSLPIHTNNS